MVAMSTGGDAVAMQKAIMAGQDFPPPGVAGTPANRELWDKITRDIASMPPDVLPDIPHDWVDTPDD